MSCSIISTENTPKFTTVYVLSKFSTVIVKATIKSKTVMMDETFSESINFGKKYSKE